VALTPWVEALWQQYRSFKFHEVIAAVTRASASDDLRGYTLATACTLAAASAYVVNDQRTARPFIIRSVSVCPAVRPDPMVFPAGFCAAYQSIVMGMEEPLKDTSSD
jgi:hypothetical protein